MAEGDYPGGRTPWESYDVPQLAGHLTENLGRAWGQARAWHNAADTTAGYLDALRRLRANLVAVWPPDRSPAAKAYVERLDSLIASVDDVRDATAGTGEALAGVLSSLEGARPQMDQWREEWGPQEDTAPNALDGTQDQSRRLELNQKAQQHMRELDDAVFPYQSRMRAPQPWDPRGDIGGDPGDPSGGSGDSAAGSGGGGGGRAGRGGGAVGFAAPAPT